MLFMLILGILIGALGTLATMYFLKEKPQELPEDFLDFFDFDEELYNELDVLFNEEEENGDETN